MTDKTFTHAGVSRLKGEFKARFANDSTRVKVLQKNGHTDIDLVELPYPMAKGAAVEYLLSIEFYKQNDVENAEVKAALEAEQDKRTPKADDAATDGSKDKPAKEPKKPKKPKAAKPDVELPAADAPLTPEQAAQNEMEDAPF